MKTKNLCGILMLFSFLVSCTEQQCIIHGITTGVKDGDYMYITEYLDNTYFDSAVVMNENLHSSYRRLQKKIFCLKL